MVEHACRCHEAQEAHQDDDHARRSKLMGQADRVPLTISTSRLGTATIYSPGISLPSGLGKVAAELGRTRNAHGAMITVMFRPVTDG